MPRVKRQKAYQSDSESGEDEPGSTVRAKPKPLVKKAKKKLVVVAPDEPRVSNNFFASALQAALATNESKSAPNDNDDDDDDNDVERFSLARARRNRGKRTDSRARAKRLPSANDVLKGGAQSQSARRDLRLTRSRSGSPRSLRRASSSSSTRSSASAPRGSVKSRRKRAIPTRIASTFNPSRFSPRSPPPTTAKKRAPAAAAAARQVRGQARVQVERAARRFLGERSERRGMPMTEDQD
jgi:hypothetical protein